MVIIIHRLKCVYVHVYKNSDKMKGRGGSNRKERLKMKQDPNTKKV